MNKLTDNHSDSNALTARITYKQIAVMALIGLTCAATGYFVSSYTVKSSSENSAAPMIYVARCGFHFAGENCGEKSRDVIFQSSDEFLSFTDNWAVGRRGSYKMYMSCFGPADEDFIDGTFSSLTVVVAGPNLTEAYEISSQLMADFSDQLSEQSASVSHCIEQKNP